MEKQLDAKEAAADFKFIKKNYVMMNKASTVRFDYRDNEIQMTFIGISDPEFSVLYGKLLTENAFTEWLSMKEGTVDFLLSDMRVIKECLVKNIVGIKYDDDSFTYEYEKDGIHSAVCLHRHPFSSYRESRIITKAQGTFSHSAIISQSEYDGDIFRLFIDDESGAVNSEDHGKILVEVPVKHILSYQKDAEYKVKYSDILESGYRYVRLSSKGSDMTLYQLFATV